MKTKFLTLTSIAAMAIGIISCGEKKEEPKEEPAKDTTAVKEEVPAYEYTYKVEEVDVTPRWAVTIGDSTTIDQLSDFFMKNFPALGKAASLKKEEMTDAPFALYYDFAFDKKFYTKACMYISDSTRKVKAPAKVEKMYGGKAVKVVYFGAYEKTETAYNDIMAYIEENKFQIAGAPWEQYVTDPGMEKDTAKWQTDIYFPVVPGGK